MYDLDETDLEIHQLLMSNARRPYSDIADAVGLSAPAVSDRVARLQEMDIINRFTLNVDHSQLRKDIPVLLTLDVAIEAADVTLMHDDPLDVVKAIRISDATLAKIKQNLVWALGYNTAMIPLALLDLLQPVLAAGAMAFSSVSMLSNSLLFRRYTPDHSYKLLGRLR